MLFFSKLNVETQKKHESYTIVWSYSSIQNDGLILILTHFTDQIRNTRKSCLFVCKIDIFLNIFSILCKQKYNVMIKNWSKFHWDCIDRWVSNMYFYIGVLLLTKSLSSGFFWKQSIPTLFYIAFEAEDDYNSQELITCWRYNFRAFQN